MYGFKKGAGHAGRKQFADGGAVEDEAKAARGFGMVRGPGTGTSDSVKDAVPAGTYIMPADSTRQIGSDALGAAGFRPDALPKNPDGPSLGFGKNAGKVPVNLSNGEFRLSPEQVHGIGVQVLEGLKAATHEPAGEGEGTEEGEGEEDDGDDRASGELFFVDGGLVERTAKYWSEDNKRFEQTNPGIASRIGRAINPLTSFGSAMGAMHDAAGAGDGVGMALAGASSIPAFGVMRAAGPAIKSIIPAPAVLVPSIKGTAASVATNGLVGAAADAYEPEPRGYADGGLIPSQDDTANIVQQVTGGYGLRRDGSPKGDGYFGPLATSDGSTMTEFSGEADVDGKRIHFPLVTPNQSFKDLSNVLTGGRPTGDMYDKAIEHAQSRILTGRSPFATSGEQRGFQVQNFVDGGLADDPNKKRPLATSPTNTYPGNQAERAGNIYAQSNADMITRIGDASRAVPGASLLADGSQTRMVAGQIGNAWNENADKGNYAKAAGATLRGTAAMIPAAMEDSMNATARRMQPAVEFGKGLFGIEDAKPTPAQATTPAPAAPAPTTPAATAANPDTKPVPDPAKSYMDAGPVPYTVTPVENTNGVQRINQKGQSPLFTNIDPGQAVAEMKGNPVGGFQPASVRGDAAGAAPSGPGLGFGPGSAAGSPDVMGILQRESDIRAGMGSIQDRINFNSGNGVGFRQTEQGERGFTTIRDGAQADRDRAAVMDAALKPLAGARNGQLTANQLRTAQRMVEADQRNEQSRYQTDANAATQLETTGMREAGESQRKQGELGLRKEAQGFQSRAAQRQEDLQAKYEAAKTPEERSDIAQQIRDLSGKQEPQNRFTVVPGGQEWDANAGAMRNVPSRVINNQTGLDVERPTQGAGQQPVANHIAALKKNPEQAAMFDSVYGKGAAARYIGAGNGS